MALGCFIPFFTRKGIDLLPARLPLPPPERPGPDGTGLPHHPPSSRVSGLGRATALHDFIPLI